MQDIERIFLGECGYLSHGTKFARPGSKPCYGPDQNFDTQHIRLELKLNIAKKTVDGKCITTFKAINDGAKEIHFDAVGMKILSVSQLSEFPLSNDSGNTKSQKLRSTYKKEKLAVKLQKPVKENEIVSIAVQYRISNPVAGVYFVGPDKFYPDKPVQVWTHGEAEESRYWFPCFDAPHDKATTEMFATVPQDFFALSNGALVDVQEDRVRKTKTYHWEQAIAHSPYLVTLVAGKFFEIKDEWDGIPILYYCPPGREADTKRAFGKTPKMVQFFSEKIGVRYPYEKYAQIAVADFVMGGMEHTTATTQTDRVLMDARAYPEFTADWLVSHELAHQWFGDLLTCKEWSHAWLNESFATYFEALFTEFDLGRDEFEYEMQDKLQLYLDEGKRNYHRSIVTNIYRKPDDMFDRHLYEKGSLVLHMLRSVLGDVLFWKAIHHYVETFQGQAVETNDLINSIQESTGKNMRKFFDQWIYKAGHPEYTVNYWWDNSRKAANLQITQKTAGRQELFSVPVEIEFITSAGKRKYNEIIEEKKHEFTYRFNKEPLDVRFDPSHSILKTAEIVKPYEMWVRQLESDPAVAGKVHAAREIAKVATERSVRVLARSFRREKFWGTAKEIALALGRTRLESAKEFLTASLKVKNPKVRRGVVDALGQFQDDKTVAKLKEIFQKDKSYFVAAESVRSLGNNRTSRSDQTIKRALNTRSWNDVIRSSAIQTLSRNPTEESIRLMKKFSRYGFHPAARASAVNSISKCAKNFPELFEDLIAITADRQVRLKHSAISALGDLKDPRAIPTLEKIFKDKILPHRTRLLAEDSLLKIRPDKSSSS